MHSFKKVYFTYEHAKAFDGKIVRVVADERHWVTEYEGEFRLHTHSSSWVGSNLVIHFQVESIEEIP